MRTTRTKRKEDGTEKGGQNRDRPSPGNRRLLRPGGRWVGGVGRMAVLSDDKWGGLLSAEYVEESVFHLVWIVGMNPGHPGPEGRGRLLVC
jgi:hypothetical protein